jgi:hypothetical protein
MGRDENTKAVARCTSCENIFPVEIGPDRTIHPIGMGTGCCEGMELEVLEG